MLSPLPRHQHGFFLLTFDRSSSALGFKSVCFILFMTVFLVPLPHLPIFMPPLLCRLSLMGRLGYYLLSVFCSRLIKVIYEGGGGRAAAHGTRSHQLISLLLTGDFQPSPSGRRSPRVVWMLINPNFITCQKQHRGASGAQEKDISGRQYDKFTYATNRLRQPAT